MRIGQVILRVEDLERSVGFWSRSLGFEVTMQAGSFAFIDANGIQLTLNQIEDVPGDDSLTEIVIEVDDIRSSYRELSERGVPFEVEPRAVTSDGERELWAAHFCDPDGHLGSVVGWVS
jgi:catechol 2,3-dioxygenase-like lactoylglutathione lyase family enzyme